MPGFMWIHFIWPILSVQYETLKYRKNQMLQYHMNHISMDTSHIICWSYKPDMIWTISYGRYLQTTYVK